MYLIYIFSYLYNKSAIYRLYITTYLFTSIYIVPIGTDDRVSCKYIWIYMLKIEKVIVGDRDEIGSLFVGFSLNKSTQFQ